MGLQNRPKQDRSTQSKLKSSPAHTLLFLAPSCLQTWMVNTINLPWLSVGQCAAWVPVALSEWHVAACAGNVRVGREHGLLYLMLKTRAGSLCSVCWLCTKSAVSQILWGLHTKGMHIRLDSSVWAGVQQVIKLGLWISGIPCISIFAIWKELGLGGFPEVMSLRALPDQARRCLWGLHHWCLHPVHLWTRPESWPLSIFADTGSLDAAHL